MWNKEKIHALLDANPKAVVRGLLAIYALQTNNERVAGSTHDANGVGFSAYDAPFLSDIADKVRNGWNLSPKQLAITRNKMKHYHRQLAEIANQKEACKAEAHDATIVQPACHCENYDGEQKCHFCRKQEERETEMAESRQADFETGAVALEARSVAERGALLSAGDHW